MQTAPLTCPNCQTAVQPTWRRCPECGQELTSSATPSSPAAPVVQLVCPACGGKLPLPADGQVYVQCPYCRSSLQLQRGPGGVSLAQVNQMGEVIGARIGQQVGEQIRREMGTLPGAPGPDPQTATRMRQEAELDHLEGQVTMLQLRIGQLQREGNTAAAQEARATLRQTEARITTLRQALHLSVKPASAAQARPPTAIWIRMGLALVLTLGLVGLVVLWLTPLLGGNAVWVGVGLAVLIVLGLAALIVTNAS